MNEERVQKVLEIVRRKGVLRPKDLAPHGIHRAYLGYLHARGLVQKVGRGLYVVPDAEVTSRHTLAEACKRVPSGVVCLLSALQFHELTTQTPFQVWMAIPEKAWLPKVDRPVIRFVRFSGKSLESGIEEHEIEGVSVPVFDGSKTVVDCFKYRNKIGLDVALEALRDCRRQRKCTNDELWHYAKICRMTNVMRPYLEALE